MAMLIMAKTTSYDDRLGFANPFYNMYGYRSNLAVIDELNQFADQFIASIIPPVTDIMSVSSYILTVEFYELNGTGYVARTGTGVTTRGDRTGETMPGFVAWGFQYLRAATGDRSGSKRIGTISESDVENGNAASGVSAALNACAAALAAPIQFGLIDTWFPEILERPVAPSTVWGSHPIAGVTYKRVTTQNSRKN